MAKEYSRCSVSKMKPIQVNVAFPGNRSRIISNIYCTSCLLGTITSRQIILFKMIYHNNPVKQVFVLLTGKLEQSYLPKVTKVLVKANLGL